MLLTKSQNYLKKGKLKKLSLPAKIREIFTSMEEFEKEFKTIELSDRKQFESFIKETDNDVLKALENEYTGLSEVKAIVKERRSDQASFDTLDAYMNRQPQTRELYSKDGKYSKDRQKIHEKIIKEAIDGIQCIARKKPIAIMTGGLPGAGKTTWINKNSNWMQHPAIFKVYPDELREGLPGYEGWNASLYQKETGDMVRTLLKETEKAECRYDIIYDGTMKNLTKYINLIKHLKSKGYKIYLIYMDVPLQVSLDRAVGRYKKTGRYVPLDAIRSIGNKGIETFEKLRELSYGWILVDTKEGRIKEQGGKEIPADRDYSKLGEATTSSGSKIAKNADNKPTKRESVLSAARALKTSARYSKGEQKKSLLATAKALEVAAKYL